MSLSQTIQPVGLTATPRSALFVPGDRPSRFESAISSGADAVIVDLEDAVGPGAKDDARRALLRSEVLTAPDRLPLLTVRVNAPDTAAGAADLEAIGRLPIDAVVVPKAGLAAIELAASLRFPLIALIETARGVLDAAEIAAHPAVSMLFLGALDLGAELGVEESDTGDELILARSQVVLASASSGLVAPLDSPCAAARESGPLTDQLARARRLGFGGKSCIHPAQVPIVNAAFRPPADAVCWSRRVVEAFDAADGGVTVLDGRMIDRPVVERAHQILSDDERDRWR